MTVATDLIIREDNGHLIRVARGKPVRFEINHMLSAANESLDGAVKRDAVLRAFVETLAPHRD